MKKIYDPRSVFLSTCFLVISLVIMNNKLQTVLCAIIIIIHAVLLGINFKSFLKIFMSSLWLLLSIILINYFLIGRDIYYIFNSVSRLFGIIILATVIISSLDVMDMGFAVENIFYPLKYFKIPIESISTVIALSLKFIPLMKNEALRIYKAQKARGLDYKLMSLIEKIYNITNLLIPIVVSSIQTSINTASAMEVRGYGAPYEKTRLYGYSMTFKDISYISFTFIFMIIIILIK